MTNNKWQMPSSTLRALKAEVFDHLSYARILLRDQSFLGKALDQLNALLQYPEEEYFERIYEVHDNVQQLSPITLSNDYNHVHLRYASIIWELVCLLAFYTHPDNTLWLEHFLPRMKALLPPILQEETADGEKRIQKHLDDRKQLTQAIHQTRKNPANKVTSQDKPTMEDLENTFSYVFRNRDSFPLFIEDLLADRQQAEDPDWARDALTIYEHWRLFLKKKPTSFKDWLKQFCNLFGRQWKRDYDPSTLKRSSKLSTVDKYITPN